MGSKRRSKFKSRAPIDSTIPAQAPVHDQPELATPHETHKLICSWAALIIALTGLAVFATGLISPFWGDDNLQIVENIPVHSIANTWLFFQGGTFYNGQGLAPLSGVYYRPLMTTVFSLVYSLFGPNAIAFHLLQLGLYITAAVLLCLIFRYSFKPALALALSLIFLVHPLNSQVVFAIASMQDVLFFLFGTLALWLLLRYGSVKSLWLVAGCLLLSLLSKETGVLFLVLALLYLFWFDRGRLKTFAVILVLPSLLYLVFRIHAVGLAAVQTTAQIDQASLFARLLTAPSVMFFGISKLLFPWRLSTGYYWVYSSFSFTHVLLPLVVDAAAVALVVMTAKRIHRASSEAQYHTFLFFAVWAAIGLLPYLQIVPLDMTVSETWFYFSLAGVMGMIGVVLTVFKPPIGRKQMAVVTAVLILALGLLTAVRGLDWHDPFALALKDISGSAQDFNAYAYVADGFIAQSNYTGAISYAEKSVAVYPNFDGYSDLGDAQAYLGNYAAAYTAYTNALPYGSDASLYERVAQLAVVSGNPATNSSFFSKSVKLYPQDAAIWEYLALFDEIHGNNSGAKISISNSADYTQLPPALIYNINNEQPFPIYLPGLKRTINIP